MVAGGTRVKRKIGLKRSPGEADGLTRTQAERELRRLVDATNVMARGQRRTIGEAGDAYVAHLENVMERKRTTIADCRGYFRRHLAPFFGDRPAFVPARVLVLNDDGHREVDSEVYAGEVGKIVERRRWRGYSLGA